MSVAYQGERSVDERTSRLLLAAILLVWLAASLPLLIGTSTLVHRDVFGIHLPLKAFGAAELGQGRIPHFNPTWGLGEPFRGDPNALPLYPGNLLYLLLPFWSAFNAHYCLHWLLAFFTMRAMARELGMSSGGVLMAALTYAGGGWMLSNLSFYNIITVAAWWPLVALGVLRSDRRGLAIGGLACGLALLGGDPITALLGVPVLLVVGYGVHDTRRLLGRVVTVGILGLLLATPQIVATARILDFAARTTISSAAPTFALHPLRLLELAVPLPWGRSADYGPGQLLIGTLFDKSPFVLTIHVGVVGLLLAVGAIRRHKRWALLAAAGLAVASLSGPLERFSQNIFRYPEKFLLWFAFGAALLAGWGLAKSSGRRLTSRAAMALIALCVVLMPITLIAGDQIVTWLGSGLTAEQLTIATPVAKRALLIAAAVSALLSAATLWGIRRSQVGALLLLQVVCLLRLYPLIITDSTSFYRDPAPWTARVGDGTGVLMGVKEPAISSDTPVYALSEQSEREFCRIRHLDLDFPTGVLHRLRYPVHHEGSGLGSPLLAIVRRNMGRIDWQARTNWFRVMGLQFVTAALDSTPPGTRLVDRAIRSGVPTSLLEVQGVAPRAWWPETVVPVANADAAYRHVSTVVDPVASVAAPGKPDHVPGASIVLLEEQPDRILVEVSGGGGVLAVQRAYHALLRARIDGAPVRTLPVQLILLGVEVPAGTHQVEIYVSNLPDRLALLGVLGALLAVAFLWLPTAGKAA